MAEAESSVGQHLAELYNSIHQHEQKVEAAKDKVTEEEAALAKVKTQFADYLKQKGIYDLIAPAQAVASSDKTSTNQKADSKERKPRISSKDKQAQVERNKAIYISTYPNGIDEKTGLPKRFKGRGQGNVDIDAQMKDDERDYEAKSGGDNVNLESPLPDSITKGTKRSTVAGYQEAAATAPKAASKGKTKAELQPA